LPLFMALLSDLFPGVDTPPADGGSLRAAIEAELTAANLQVCASTLTPAMCLFLCYGRVIGGRRVITSL
jgi:dynein heavy chain